MKRVYLEITNACNLNCPFCTYKKGNRFLSLEDIEDTISQIKPFCNYIYLHILGEPTLHPSFNEILNLLDKNDFMLQLVTNGTLLYKYPDLLSHKSLRKLSISLHSINNMDVDAEYFNNIDSLIESNIDKTIELRFYDEKHLDNKLNNYLKKLKDKYSYTDTKKQNSYRLKDNLYVYFEKLFKWPDIHDEVIGSIGTCHGAIDMIGINSNLDVTICCLDPEAHNYLGNLKEKTLAEILESKEYLSYINDFKNHKINSELCKRCNYRLRFK